MTIHPKDFHELLVSSGIKRFVGVPDSLLKDVCAYITENVESDSHFIVANEGNAVAMATGFYLGSRESSLVYLQNSGLGNTINPLLSLAHREIYSIPMLLLIGWRGEPGIKDEPQHKPQGKVTGDILDACGIPWFEIGPNLSRWQEAISDAIELMNTSESPVAIVVRKGTFSSFARSTPHIEEPPMSREEAISTIIDTLDNDYLFVSTTGMASRELFECRVNKQMSHIKDFMSVGSMGHVSSIAFGVATACKDKKIVCLDGDGSMLMHLGATAIIVNSNAGNMLHIVLNNGAHDSVGGQPTVAKDISLSKIAEHCGYNVLPKVDNKPALIQALGRLPKHLQRPTFLELDVSKGSRPNLGRPTSSPLVNRNEFMNSCSIQ